jgi:signal transduction histidine kinase
MGVGWTSRVRAWVARHPRAVDAGFAAGLFAVTAPDATDRLGDPGSAHAGASPLLAWVLLVALMAPLAWRRSAPAVVFAVVAAVAFVQWLTVPPFGGDVALLVALYTVAAHDRRGWVVAAATGVLAAGVALVVPQSGTDDPLLSTVALVAMITAAVALGLYARVRRSYVESLLEGAAAAERARITRELHDVVSHGLSVMVALADGAGYAARDDPAMARTAMRQVASSGRQALEEMQRLLGVLGDGAPGLQPQPGTAQLEELLDQLRAVGLEARLSVVGSPLCLGEGLQLTVYRLVQEALTNVIKHARGATAAEVRVRYGNGAIDVQVDDDGRPSAGLATGIGRGLAGMRERGAAYGGTVAAGPRPGGGWRVRASLPIGEVCEQ